MKKVFLIIIFFSLNSFGQANELDLLRKEAINIKSLYFKNYYESELLKNNESVNRKIFINNFKKKYENIYLLDEKNIPITLKEDNIISFKSIDVNSNKDKRKIKKGINVWRTFYFLKDNQLTFVIVDGILKYENGTLKFGVIDSSIVIYEYSCDEKKWKLKSQEHNDI